VAFITGPAKSLFIPMALSVVFAMMTSYFLSRTLVPTMVHYLLESEVELYGGVEQEGLKHDHSAKDKHVGFVSSFFWAVKVWVVLAVVCLLGALVGWWRYSHPVRETVTARPRAVAPPVAKAPVTPPTASDPAPAPVPEFDGLAHLKVRAIEDSWILVKADGKVILDGTLDAATEKSFAAKELIFKTGNAGGVEVTYNGKTEAPFGKDKQVKEIKIKPEKKPVS